MLNYWQPKNLWNGLENCVIHLLVLKMCYIFGLFYFFSIPRFMISLSIGDLSDFFDIWCLCVYLCLYKHLRLKIVLPKLPGSCSGQLSYYFKLITRYLYLFSRLLSDWVIFQRIMLSPHLYRFCCFSFWYSFTLKSDNRQGIFSTIF